MQLAFSVLLFFLAYVATAEYQRPAVYNVNPYNRPNNVEQRFLIPTTTTTSTTTFTITCTKSLNPAPAACNGRRRRDILFAEEEIDEESLNISPSALQGYFFPQSKCMISNLPYFLVLELKLRQNQAETLVLLIYRWFICLHLATTTLIQKSNQVSMADL